MAAIDEEALAQRLKKRRVCRFCLSVDQNILTSIYTRDTRIKSSAPLPIQIMAIASIEVFSNDGMPGFVCANCTNVFEYSYQFKQMCKKADNLLRQFPLTGKWPKALVKPVLTPILKPVQAPKQRTQPVQPVQNPVGQESLLKKNLILNADPSSYQVSAQPLRIAKVEKNVVDDSKFSSFLSKIENNDELSLDDVQQLVAAEDVAESELNANATEELPVTSGKPKLLNKFSVRILNKDVDCNKEPRLSLPTIKKGKDGNMEVIAEIIADDAPFETEPEPKSPEIIDTNVYPCPHCERSFPLLQLRDIHLKNHSRDRHFQCEECDKSFFSKYDLQRHSFTHNGAKPFKCTACDKAFSRTSLLQRHEKSHTDIPKFICITCERPFLCKESMEKHAERHKIYRPFTCKICNKGFAFKQGLERHEVIHSRQQPFSCQYCSQSFSTTTKLARHLTAHAGDRPYPCKFCKKSYLLSHHLTRHMRSHKNTVGNTSGISFMCIHCNKCFDSRDDLILHSTTHADEKNLSCPLCKEVADSITSLTEHIKAHSEGEAFACEFCDLIFMKGDKLQLHIDNDHTQEMEAYHEDDRMQAERMRVKTLENDVDISEESLQTTVDEILLEDGGEATIKKERGSPKILSQVVVQGANEKGEDKSILIPLKKIKIEGSDKITTKVATKTQQPSPSLRRKVASPAANRDKNQPTIQSMMKLPSGITVKKATATKEETKAPVAVTKTRSQSGVSPKNKQNVLEMEIDNKNVKVQKIRVTKAQAAAMAKEGRIKIKSGKIILTPDK